MDEQPPVESIRSQGRQPHGSGGAVRYRCSFCGKAQDEVARLIAGPGAVYICDECVKLCNEIVGEEEKRADEPPIWEAEPARTIEELMQDDRFLNEASRRNLVFQVGPDKKMRVYQELDGRNYIFGVGPHGRNIVYRALDAVELAELDRSLKE